MLLGHFADMWCNYRDWKNRDKKNWAHFKFWNKDGVAEVFFAPWNHLNFPLVFSDHSRISWDSAKHCDIDAGNVRGFLSKQEVRNIGNASCLPILLPLRKTEKPYQVKDCLNLIWDLSDNMEQIDKMAACFEPTVSNKKKLSRRHREIIRFYVEFLDFLNELVNVENDKKAVAKLLRNSYTDALLDLGAMPAKATIEQQEKACLLGSMYLAKDVLKESRYRDNILAAINGLKKYLGRDVVLTDFAEFVRECLKKNSKYQEIFCYQDEDGIYLFYNRYWEGFKNYCDSNHLVIKCGAAAFRRNVLEKYISPQYDPSNPRKYPRYDYRKKVDNEKAVVLKVSPKILKLKWDN